MVNDGKRYTVWYGDGRQYRTPISAKKEFSMTIALLVAHDINGTVKRVLTDGSSESDDIPRFGAEEHIEGNL